ncbi:uncharacterized protein LOC126318300 [Schistocerca gregaria]|uniref:uncharacterized protein LOC126318300 n=1 Tax=Schistocerca gregaria TaxID=7010 RepID=UPI00211F3ADE|nr:uncharacterized protein LOC126318300 [Schistocerca gregaria]
MNFQIANQQPKAEDRRSISNSDRILAGEYRPSVASSNQVQAHPTYRNAHNNARYTHKKKTSSGNKNQYRDGRNSDKLDNIVQQNVGNRWNPQSQYLVRNGDFFYRGNSASTSNQGKQAMVRANRPLYKQPPKGQLVQYAKGSTDNSRPIMSSNSRNSNQSYIPSKNGQLVALRGPRRVDRPVIEDDSLYYYNEDAKTFTQNAYNRQNNSGALAPLNPLNTSNRQNYYSDGPTDNYSQSLSTSSNPWITTQATREVPYLTHDTANFLKNKNIIVCISNFSSQVSTVSVLNTLGERTQFQFNHYGVFEDELWIEVQTPADALALMKLNGLQFTSLGIQPVSIRLCFLRSRLRLHPEALKEALNQLIPLGPQIESLDLTKWGLKNYSSGISFSFPPSLSSLCECILSYAINIHTLSLSDNAISSAFPLEPLVFLQNLRILDLGGNIIRTIHDISILSQFPMLRELILVNNPISFERDYRLLVLELIPNLLVLDHEQFPLQISFGDIERDMSSELLPADNPFFFSQGEIEEHVNLFIELLLCTFDTDRKKLTGAYRARGSYFSCKVFRVEDIGRAPCKNTYAHDAFDIIQCILEFPASKHEPPKRCDFLWLPNMQQQALLVISGHVTFAEERYIYQRSITLIPYNIEERWKFTIINDILMLTQMAEKYEAIETQNSMVYD